MSCSYFFNVRRRGGGEGRRGKGGGELVYIGEGWRGRRRRGSGGRGGGGGGGLGNMCWSCRLVIGCSPDLNMELAWWYQT